MQLEHSFSMPVPVSQAWELLLDVERIAPILPGATVESVVGDTVEGRFKVKIGPIQVSYTGSASFVERDAAARRITVEAKGLEIRGEGAALATIVAHLREASPHVTEVSVVTDLTLTGRPAQFGRGVLVGVGQRLLDRFAVSVGELVVPRTPVLAAVGAGPAPLHEPAPAFSTVPRQSVPPAPAEPVAAARDTVPQPRAETVAPVASPVTAPVPEETVPRSGAWRYAAIGGAVVALYVGWRLVARRRR